VVIDDKGHILTIGYLILEAEAIEVIGAQGDPVKASFVAYDYKTGFGILRADPPLFIPLQAAQGSDPANMLCTTAPPAARS
jgi:S1-C subfamily serine protease